MYESSDHIEEVLRKMPKGDEMKILTLTILILIALIILALAPGCFDGETVQPQETPNPVPMSYVNIGKRYHGTLHAEFREHRWYFQNKDGEWCKLFRYPEGI